MLSLGKEAMEGPSLHYLTLPLPCSAWARKRWMDLSLLEQGNDGRTFLSLPCSRSFSFPLPLLCSPWVGKRWKGLPFFTFLSLFLAPSSSLLLSLGKEAMEDSFSLPLPLFCSPWARKGWMDLPLFKVSNLEFWGLGLNPKALTLALRN